MKTTRTGGAGWAMMGALAWLAMVGGCATARAEEVIHADVVIYGATPGGVMAAVAAGRHGHTVALVEMRTHVGGVVSGGLIATDIGNRETVGGLASEFFDRNKKYYIDTYGPDSDELKRYRDGLALEPSIAELVFERMMKETGKVSVYKGNLLESIAMDGDRITSITTKDMASGGKHTFTGSIFVDATYTGDILPLAKVPYHLGREGRAEYGETLAGIAAPKAERGEPDDRLMAFNYRVTITNKPGNTVPFPKPVHYDPAPWQKTIGERIKKQKIGRFIDTLASGESRFGPNMKCDLNWGDLPGGNVGYVEGDYATREKIELAHRDYFQSMLYYVQNDLPNDPECPPAFAKEIKTWGLPKDEFADTGHFPFQIYIREGRRMIGQSVLRQQDITQDNYKTDGIAEGSYGIDCHAVRYVIDNGKRVADQTMHYGIHPYDIPYGCLVPKTKPTNLLVPVSLSTTHVAYCSLRMEPVFMMLGHATGDAAALALDGRTSVQDVDVKRLRAELTKENAILTGAYRPRIKIRVAPEHPKVGEKVSFQLDQIEVHDPLTKVWWDFDGNGGIGAETEQATHTFTADKVYNVSVVVQDKARRRRMVSVEVPVGTAVGKDVTIDESLADFQGRWSGSYPSRVARDDRRSQDVFIGPGARYEDGKEGMEGSVKFTPTIPRTGRYEVCIAYRPGKYEPANVPVEIQHADGIEKKVVNQQTETTPFPFVSLGVYRFEVGSKAAYVELSDKGVDKGRVGIDGVRWVWIGG